MAVVTGLTAARMLDIEAASIVGGSVNGSGHLILTRHDGGTIDGGDIVGPNAVDIYNDQTVAGIKTFTSDLKATSRLLVGGGSNPAIHASGSSEAGQQPIAEFYEDNSAGGMAGLVVRGAPGSTAVYRASSILLKMSSEGSSTESNKGWEIASTSSLGYGNSPSLVIRNITTGSNAIVVDGATNLMTLLSGVAAASVDVGAGTGSTWLELKGVAGGYSGVGFKTGSSQRWNIYRSPAAEAGSNAGSDFAIARYSDAGAYIDNVLTINRANGGISVSNGLSVTGALTLATGIVGTTPAGSTTDIVNWIMADNDGFRIRVGGASNSGWVEFATNDDAAEQIYFRQYSPGWTTAVRTLTLLDASGNTSVPGLLSASRISAGYDGGSGIGTDSWFRSSGATGWYNASYNVGIYSTRAGWIDTYASAALQVNNSLVVTGGGSIQVTSSGKGTSNYYPITPNLATKTSSTSGINAATTVLTTTTIGDGTHSVIIQAHIPGLIFTVATDVFSWAINANGSAIASGFVRASGGTGQGDPFVVMASHVPAASATTTYTLSFTRYSGTGTLTVAASASSLGLLFVHQLV